MEEHVHDGPQARHAPVSDAHKQMPNPKPQTVGRVPGTWMSVPRMAGHQVGHSSCGHAKPASQRENAPGVILVRSGGITGNGQLLPKETLGDASLRISSPENPLHANRFSKKAIANPMATCFSDDLPDLRIVHQSEARVTILRGDTA